MSSRVRKLPLWRYKNVPGVPIEIGGTAKTLLKLAGRSKAIKPAKLECSNIYKIDGDTARGYEYMYGLPESSFSVSEPTVDDLDLGEVRYDELIDLEDVSHEEFEARLIKEIEEANINTEHEGGESFAHDVDGSLTLKTLEDPAQYAMGWTTKNGNYDRAKPFLEPWSKSLTDADAATKLFWPMIAHYGMAYNLFILKKVGDEQVGEARAIFGADWSADMQAAFEAGNLYCIDMRIFKEMKQQVVKKRERFTPSTYTLLQQDPSSKAITPMAVQVAAHKGENATNFVHGSASDSAWVYALQAAKVSITVYGIWLGHVYQWHIVTAAMQMAMYNSIQKGHMLYDMLEPISKYLIGFDNVLFILWKQAAPPASINTTKEFLILANAYGNNRSVFADEPPAAIEALGLDVADFTDKDDWDRYPIVKLFLPIWKGVNDYVAAFIKDAYPSDEAVANDSQIQAWWKELTGHANLNLEGLSGLKTRDDLHRILANFIYRPTVHGISRLGHTANPALTFVGNFPPTLQRWDIPSPDAEINTRKMLSYMPNTGTIGEMINFYFTFSYSAPYEPAIPYSGIDSKLFYPESQSSLNDALVDFRTMIQQFILSFDTVEGVTQTHQWPMNIET